MQAAGGLQGRKMKAWEAGSPHDCSPCENAALDRFVFRAVTLILLLRLLGSRQRSIVKIVSGDPKSRGHARLFAANSPLK
jgi:hypothetical protein